MNEQMPTEGSHQVRLPLDFSIVLGGPLFQLLRRAHLCDEALGLVRLRILVISLLSWLPLLAPGAFGGQLLGGGGTGKRGPRKGRRTAAPRIALPPIEGDRTMRMGDSSSLAAPERNWARAQATVAGTLAVGQ